MDRYKWIISLVPVVLSILMIRQYLGFFDNATLFTENLSVMNSFVFIFVTLISAVMLLIFYLPSIILFFDTKKGTWYFILWEDKRKNSTSLPHHNASVYIHVIYMVLCCGKKTRL